MGEHVKIPDIGSKLDTLGLVLLQYYWITITEIPQKY